MDAQNEQGASGNGAAYRPKLSYFHANAKGGGSAVQFELHPAHDDVEGSIFATFAAQKTVGSVEAGCRTFPTFDWQNRITVCLRIGDLAQMLEVFRGCRESVADGKGLFHRSAKANTIIRLEHRIDPVPGFVFEVSRKSFGGDLVRVSFLFSMSEALGFAQSVEGALHYVAFGIPQVHPRAARAAAAAKANPGEFPEDPF